MRQEQGDRKERRDCHREPARPRRAASPAGDAAKGEQHQDRDQERSAREWERQRRVDPRTDRAHRLHPRATRQRLDWRRPGIDLERAAEHRRAHREVRDAEQQPWRGVAHARDDNICCRCPRSRRAARDGDGQNQSRQQSGRFLARQSACRGQQRSGAPAVVPSRRALKKGERRQHEQQREKIVAPGNPRHRFGTGGKQQKDRRGNRRSGVRPIAGLDRKPSSDGKHQRAARQMQGQIGETPSEGIGACQRKIEAEARHRKRPVIKARRVQPGVKLGDERVEEVSSLRPIRQGREHRVIVAQQCTGEGRQVDQRTGGEGRQHENGGAPSQVSHSARFRD